MLRLIQPFVQENYVDHKLLKYELIQKGYKNIKVVEDKLLHEKPYPKENHEGFNILYYFPKDKKNIKFMKWLYGYDIYEQLVNDLENVNWIIVDGSYDMTKIYPIVDFFLRPTRHDGASRMRQECELNNIPYYWSQQNPNIKKAKEEIDKCR